MNSDIRCRSEDLCVNGTTFTYSGLIPGDTVTYKCNNLTQYISGNLTRTCQMNGTWSGELPHCEGITYVVLSVLKLYHVHLTAKFIFHLLSFSLYISLLLSLSLIFIYIYLPQLLCVISGYLLYYIGVRFFFITITNV